MNAQTEKNTLIMDFFKSMTNEERLRIIGALATENLTLEELSTRLSLPAGTLSHHVEKLVELGLIHLENQTYRLDTRAVEAMARQTLAQQRQQTKAEDFDGEAYERKVLADFFTPQGKLKSLPAQYKKLLVILRYLVNKEFEPGVRYAEKEVNAKLSTYFVDTASLRRYMVDNRYLVREKGIYWLPESTNP
jgi:DNA-binding HxlR family transcriptional regulator